jgi:hypothetical protein
VRPQLYHLEDDTVVNYDISALYEPSAADPRYGRK